MTHVKTTRARRS
uniref:Uncharacterized protein n=1 Tax=Anguilla anguilla TaxID=7936 RepID=A0A0E9SHS9_ANGAN